MQLTLLPLSLQNEGGGGEQEEDGKEEGGVRGEEGRGGRGGGEDGEEGDEGGRRGEQLIMRGVGRMGSLAPQPRALRLEAPLSVGQLDNMTKSPAVSLLGI